MQTPPALEAKTEEEGGAGEGGDKGGTATAPESEEVIFCVGCYVISKFRFNTYVHLSLYE